ncbi:hypothetical protein [Xanthomonas sp. 60]
MSDGKTSKVEIKYISGGELARYLNAKVVNSECLRCGTKNWSLHDTEHALGTAAFLVGADGIPDPEGGAGFIPQVSLSCNNCGTMWQLSRGYVNRWLDANPLDKDVEQENDE